MKTIAAVALTALLSISSSQAATNMISFDDLTYNTNVYSQYSSLGVWFFNARTGPTRNGTLLPFGSHPGASSPTVLVSMGPDGNGFQPQPSAPIIVMFSTAMGAVSVTGLGVGANGVQLVAYDANVGGNVVDSVQYFLPNIPDDQFRVMNVTGPRILRVEFSQVGQFSNPDDTWFDNLAFTPAVPEPGTYAMLLAGIGVIVGATRRRGAKGTKRD